MIEERYYLIDNNEKMIIIERIKYNDINYMLLKNNEKPIVKIGYEYDSKLYYINEEYNDYEIISSMLIEKLEEELRKM